MSIIEAKCPNCGAPLKIDTDNDASYCEFCKTPFITEKAISVNGDYIHHQTIVKEDNEYSVQVEKEKHRLEALKYINEESNKSLKRCAIVFLLCIAILIIMALLGIE